MTEHSRNEISHLIEFILKAIKLAKYNSNTGNGLLNAVRTAERGLLPEEPKDINYLNEHLEELFLRQKDLNLSAQSQPVYFARIKRAIEDYKKYGTDAKSIYSWSPKQRVSTKPSPPKKSSINDRSEEFNDDGQIPPKNNQQYDIIKTVGGVKLNVVTWRLRPGVLIKIELPEDLTRGDVERIKRLLDLEIEIIE